mgnify:CR=1 FL=1
MRITYDKIANAAYIYLKKFTRVSKTNPISKDIILDLGPKGEVLGIEILNATAYFAPKQLKETRIDVLPETLLEMAI